MNYEEKYKSALEWMRSIYPTMQGAEKEDAEHYFPELKESEDEQHRKWILEYLYDGLRKSDEQFKYQFESAIAWLEKQGENNPYSGTSFDYNGHTWGMCARDGGVDILCDSQLIKHIEKQREQKHADNYCQENYKGYRDTGGKCFADGECEAKKKAEQKSYWSEEDEKLYTSALWHIKNSCGNGGKDSGEYEVYNWLKSLKNRVQPQPKQEWSEDDEKKRKLLIDILKVNHPNDYFKVNPIGTVSMEAMSTEELVAWLKSIKPNHWKPSEEQMQALFKAKLASTKNREYFLGLLYEDLKKL